MNILRGQNVDCLMFNLVLYIYIYIYMVTTRLRSLKEEYFILSQKSPNASYKI